MSGTLQSCPVPADDAPVEHASTRAQVPAQPTPSDARPVLTALTPEHLSMALVVADGELTVQLTGPLVTGTTTLLSTWMLRHLPATAQRVVLDLAQVPDVDGVGLGALLATRRRLGEGAVVVVTGARPQVERALRRAGLHAVLELAA